MTERWIDDLVAEPADTDPRPRFQDDLRRTLEAEWRSPSASAPPRPSRRRWWALAGAAASVAALVIALATVGATDERVPADTSGVATEPPTTPSPSAAPVPTASAPPPASTTERPSPPTTAAPTAAPTTALPPDLACLGDILAPPQLVGGGDVGEYTIDSYGDDGQPLSIRWGGDGSDAVVQVLELDPLSESPSVWFDEAAGSDQIRSSRRYEAAVIPVGDPPLGRILIYVRETGTQCIRIYLIEEGFTLEEAIAYGQSFVDELSRDAA